MPIRCPSGGKPRYGYRKGTKTRLAFCGSEVVEAKNMRTGATHTPAEFAADRARRAGGRRRKRK